MMKHITEKELSFNSVKSNVALVLLSPIIFWHVHTDEPLKVWLSNNKFCTSGLIHV